MKTQNIKAQALELLDSANNQTRFTTIIQFTYAAGYSSKPGNRGHKTKSINGVATPTTLASYDNVESISCIATTKTYGIVGGSTCISDFNTDTLTWSDFKKCK